MMLLLLVLLIPSAASAATTVIYVDPQTGSDAHIGASPATALRTLLHAQSIVRQRRAAGDTGALTVLLSGGVYELPAGLKFDSPLDGGVSAEGCTTWAAAAGGRRHAQRPRLVGGLSLAALDWQPAPSPSAGVWQVTLPPALRHALATNVPAGAGRLDGEIVELQYGGEASNNNAGSIDNSSRSRLWRARHPNADPIFPTIFGAGYLTASGGIGSLPCAFRSPHVTIETPEGTTAHCAIPPTRSYPAEPPTGLTVDLSQLASSAGLPISNWTTSRGIVHVSIYARPPDQGDSFAGGYAWIQNNLQYTVAGIRQDQESPGSAEISFGLGGQQVNSYSWVLGAANIQNGSRWYMENVPGTGHFLFHCPLRVCQGKSDWFIDTPEIN
jgi:hypothetical protein